MWDKVAKIVAEFTVSVQAVLDDYDPVDWSPWFAIPSRDYGEVKNYGPFNLNKLKFLRIDPIETRFIGMRVPVKAIDHTEAIAQLLAEQQIVFERRNGLIFVAPDMASL